MLHLGGLTFSVGSAANVWTAVSEEQGKRSVAARLEETCQIHEDTTDRENTGLKSDLQLESLKGQMLHVALMDTSACPCVLSVWGSLEETGQELIFKDGCDSP